MQVRVVLRPFLCVLAVLPKSPIPTIPPLNHNPPCASKYYGHSTPGGIGNSRHHFRKIVNARLFPHTKFLRYRGSHRSGEVACASWLESGATLTRICSSHPRICPSAECPHR